MGRSMVMIHVTEANVAEYQQRGYWISPALIDNDQITELRAACDSIFAGSSDFDCPPYRNNRRFDLQSKDLRRQINGWWSNTTIRKFLFQSAAGSIAASLMGNVEAQLWHDQVVCKPGLGPDADDRGNIGWHQDAAHWQSCTAYDNMCTAWVALQDTDLTNGGMRTIVGSHRWGLIPQANTFSNPDLDDLRQRYSRQDQPWIDEPCVLKAGQASFHHSLCLHGSGPNLTYEPRLSLIVHMMPRHNAYRKGAFYHGNEQMMGPHLRDGNSWTGPCFPVLSHLDPLNQRR